MKDQQQQEKTYRQLRFKVESCFKENEALLPPRMQGPNFYRMYNEHLKTQHSVEELEANAASIIKMIKRVSKEEVQKKLEVARNQEREAAMKQQELIEKNQKPYDDLQSAILYFDSKAKEIQALDLVAEDIEMMTIKLQEKRQRVLDEFI